MSKSKEVKEVKPNKVKAKVTDTVSTVSRVVKNAEQLVQSIALLLITVFAYTQVKDVTNDVWYYTVMFSLAVVGVRATYEFLRFLAKDK
jgi:hypothetical protein